MKKKLKFLVKLIIGIAILIFLFSKTNVQEFIDMLATADYKYFIFALFLYIFGQIISTKKWMIISQQLGFNNTFLRYLRWYFLGMFYNTFLPTNIGGDAIKVVKMRDNNTHKIKRAVISVLTDRITGVCMLSIFIMAGWIFYNSKFIINILNLGIILSVLFGILTLIFLLNHKNIIPEKFAVIYDLVKSVCEKKCMIKIIFISFVFHIFLIVIHCCIAKMYSMDIPTTYYFLLYPITAIIAALPISINGMGIKELIYVSMLNQFNIDTSHAIMFALTYNMVILFSSMTGFIPYITKENSRRKI